MTLVLSSITDSRAPTFYFNSPINIFLFVVHHKKIVQRFFAFTSSADHLMDMSPEYCVWEGLGFLATGIFNPKVS